MRAKYLFPNILECREFIKSVYLFSYLHINSLMLDGDVNKWLSKNILSCYENILLENHIDAFPAATKTDFCKILSHTGVLPGNAMSQDACGRILAKQLGQLPVLPRILFLSFYHDGLSAKEIADLFHCDESSVFSTLDQAKKFLEQSYAAVTPDMGMVLYPFNLQLVFQSLELLNQKYFSTKEFASLVWTSIASELTFKRAPRKKIFTLPLFCCFSALILAFILITMYANGYFEKTARSSSGKNASLSIDSTESDSLSSGSSGFSLDDDEDFSPSSTTTIKDENGNVTTYDESGSEIETPGASDSSGLDTGFASEGSTDTKTEGGDSSSSPSESAPSVTAPSVSEPSVTEPSVAAPSVTAPTP